MRWNVLVGEEDYPARLQGRRLRAEGGRTGTMVEGLGYKLSYVYHPGANIYM